MIDSAAANSSTTMLLLSPADHANTAAATSAAGIDVTEYEGFIIVTQNVGVVTAGTIAGAVITSDNSNLSSPTTLASFTSCGTSTDLVAESVVIEARNCKKYIGYVGTIATGPAVVGVTAVGAKKYV
jgi:hypothetical protein